MVTGRMHAIAEEIRGCRADWHGANELDELLRGLSGIAEAVADVYRQFGDELDSRTNLKPSFAEAVHDAAAGIGAIAKELDEVIGGGMLQRGGSGGVPGPPAPRPSPPPRPAAPKPDHKPTTAGAWVPGPPPLPGTPLPRTRAGMPDWGERARPGDPSRMHPRKLRRRARRAHRRATWK